MIYMRIFQSFRVSLFLLCVITPAVFAAAPERFDEAKIVAREKIYYDQNRNPQGEGTLYCGCQWEWTGKSGGRVDLNSCGYRVRSQLTRAERIEWEHIVPAWVFGHQRQCWQNGGRKNCVSEDPVFRAMEADLHNLALSVGEVNGDRSNFRYGIARGAGSQSYGQCTSRVDFKQRVFEPRDEVKGEVARVWFYMHDRYDLAMSEQQQKLLMVWDSEFPPSAAERERDRRIRAVTGQSNPFVTGERRWEPGHINSADGIFTRLPSAPVTPVNVPPKAEKKATDQRIRGNRNSKIYHFPDCPGYNRISSKNVEMFSDAASAQAAGYSMAKNCKAR